MAPSKRKKVPAGAGYSGTPLPQKLGIKPGGKVTLLDAPDDIEALLEPLPEGALLRRQGRAAADVILLFVKARADLSKRFAPAERTLAEGGRLWVAWPKKTSGVATDLTEDRVREVGLAEGLVDNKVCAIDAVWSGLQFQRRRISPPP
jgi:DUF3052 family protein